MGRGNSLDDLRVLDPQQHRSLQLLAKMECVEDACCFFAHEETYLGESVVTDLIPGGRDIPVTNENVVRYLHLIAHHRLVKASSQVSEAFAEGLFDVLERNWVQMFNGAELQQILSGGNAVMSVADLKKHVKLINFSASSRTINLLWEILEDFSDEDKGRFLQFCTGSSRAPLLGFATLNPPFSIRRYEAEGETVGIMNYLVDIDRMPAASTCFNLLKLPPYKNKSNFKEKLLSSIRSGAGFDLS